MYQEQKIFKALSDSGRVRILKMLQEGMLCVCEITEVLDLAASTVSRHLAILREADLISESKRGKWVDYCLNNDKKDILDMIFGLIDKSATSKEHYIKDRNTLKIIKQKSVC